MWALCHGPWAQMERPLLSWLWRVGPPADPGVCLRAGKDSYAATVKRKELHLSWNIFIRWLVITFITHIDSGALSCNGE